MICIGPSVVAAFPSLCLTPCTSSYLLTLLGIPGLASLLVGIVIVAADSLTAAHLNRSESKASCDGELLCTLHAHMKA